MEMTAIPWCRPPLSPWRIGSRSHLTVRHPHGLFRTTPPVRGGARVLRASAVEHKPSLNSGVGSSVLSYEMFSLGLESLGAEKLNCNPWHRNSANWICTLCSGCKIRFCVSWWISRVKPDSWCFWESYCLGGCLGCYDAGARARSLQSWTAGRSFLEDFQRKMAEVSYGQL